MEQTDKGQAEAKENITHLGNGHGVLTQSVFGKGGQQSGDEQDQVVENENQQDIPGEFLWLKTDECRK